MTGEIDDLDKNIIAALEKDGRRSFRNIGHDLDVPETTVRNCINRLVRKELIEISATGNPMKLGVKPQFGKSESRDDPAHSYGSLFSYPAYTR